MITKNQTFVVQRPELIKNKLYFYRIYIQILKEQVRKKKYKNYRKLINDTQIKLEMLITKMKRKKCLFSRRMNTFLIGF